MSLARRASYDAVIVGGGHNGLVAATYLARAAMASPVRGPALAVAPPARQDGVQRRAASRERHDVPLVQDENER